MSDAKIRDRFGEPAKFLPVLFILANIGGLYTIYMYFHAIPLTLVPSTATTGYVEMVIFNCVTLMLLICYVRCILTHPGGIPDQADGTSQWDYAPQDPRHNDSMGVNLQETKRTGDRRHCKWCAKFKPDRCHHCRVCRMCILKMDHHCPWIYNCVGFGNHKYFFLLLFYSVVATNLVTWSMLPSVRECIEPETPFVKMLSLLFGETLAAFLGLLVTMFFVFHVWLMLKAMTTIEFCEKSMKRAGYDSSTYDFGIFGNIRAALGENPLLWLIPCSPPIGDGLAFVNENTPLHMRSKDVEDGRGLRRITHQSGQKKKASRTAGTGECAGSGGESEESERPAVGAPAASAILTS